MKKVVIAGAVLVLLLLPFISIAQYISQQLDNSNGLSNSCINSILCDKDNLVWFGTWDGLNCFDGNNVHVFNYEKAGPNKNTLACNVIYQVAEDHDRNIWLGTVEGLSRYNKTTGSFSNYFYSPTKAISNGYTVAVSPNGDVYAARRNSSQIYVYNRAQDRFQKVMIDGLSDFMLLQILIDNQGHLWLSKDKGTLEGFRLANGKFYKLEKYVPVADVDNIFYCNRQVFYQNTRNELFCIGRDLVPHKVAALPHEIRSINYFKNNYFIAWSSKGVAQYDDQFKESADLINDIPLLQNVRITSVMTDGRDLLWLGTDGNGVFKLTRKENYFGLVKQQGNGQGFHIPVRAFCEVNGELWIGTKGNGIITLQNWDRENVTYSNITTFHTNVDLLDNCVYSIVKGNDGLVYIGSDAPGITVYDPASRRFIKWADILNTKKFPYFGSVHCILFDRDGSAWLGLNESGLIHLKLGKMLDGSLALEYFHQYQYNDNGSGPANNVIYSLAQGDDNLLWIGCRYGGLSLFDKKTNRFKTIKAYSYQGSLSNNDVLSVYIDKRNRLWVGTSFGLNSIDEHSAATTAEPVFNKYYVDDGLPNNTVHAISEDMNGNIWISTNKGLARVNPHNSKIVQYKESDGLQSNEFSDNAVWRTPGGMLFFGGIYGFNYFQPEKIKVDNLQPNLLLTNIHFAGRNQAEPGLFILSKAGAPDIRHFEMGPTDDSFELNAQPVSYLHSQKCQYAYLLEGNDKNWHYIRKDDRIIYNNLRPGNYTLKIKWSNGEGAWTPGITAFTLTVHQFLWLQPFAFVLYGLVALLLGYSYLRYRRNKFLIQQQLRMEHLLRGKDEEVHQAQLNFFTNITHELQTPLTLILGAVERYLFKSKKLNDENEKYLSIVKHEASRLHYLIQQLLEFRKGQSGHLKKQMECVDISVLMTEIAELFSMLTEEKMLDFSYDIQPGIVMMCDRDKLEKIIYNLLSNAFKYTKQQQYIMFSVNMSGQHTLEMVVANSGCNMAEHEMDRLFEQFFVADARDNRNSSTGIGLAFTQQLVQLLNGKIGVSCSDGWISFKAELPVGQPSDSSLQKWAETERSGDQSYLLTAMTGLHSKLSIAPTGDNNKRSLIRSFEQEHKQAILIVEDDQLIRFLLRDILNENYIVYEACSGTEALEVIKRSMPDLIISDIMMPDMNGLELCNLVKNTDETCHLPFILLSARGTIEQKTEGYQCGADAYIPKPFQQEHLLVRIEKLLTYRKKLQQVFLERLPGLSIGLNNALQEQDRSFIEKITKVIEDHLDEDIDGSFLEDAMNMSRMQLYRKIKTFSDMTPTELIRHIRLNKASFLLKHSDMTVSEIFYQTGFNNKTYFFREFKKIFNCSPNEYRSQHRLVLKKAE
jgi:signal transduction histidine kinase/DNA-binding response OmpR family regulator/ligand-binding sensor domain-containing protein